MKLKFLLLILLLALVSCTDEDEDKEETSNTPEATETAVVESAVQEVIVVGEVSDDVEEAVGYTQPVADYLAANLSEFGVTRGEVKVAPDLETMAEWMKNGEVDVYFDSLYPVMTVSDQSGATPFIRRWFDGVAEYHSVFFTLASSEFDSLDDLKGNLVALDNPFSTSGYMVPLAHLLEADFTVVARENPEETVAAEEVGYVFSFDDENTLQWVISGRVEAGVVDNESLKELPQETLDQIKILDETQPIPRQVGLVKPGIDAELLAGITRVFTEMDESEAGQAVLETMLTSQLDEFPDGIEQAIEDMRRIYELVQGQQAE